MAGIILTTTFVARIITVIVGVIHVRVPELVNKLSLETIPANIRNLLEILFDEECSPVLSMSHCQGFHLLFFTPRMAGQLCFVTVTSFCFCELITARTATKLLMSRLYTIVYGYPEACDQIR